MATRNASKSRTKITVTWQELSELLSKAEVLLPNEEIANLTLAKPKVLLIDTEYLTRDKTEEDYSG